MYKNSLTYFRDHCPLEVLKKFISEQLFNRGTSGKDIYEITIDDFVPCDQRYMTGCLVAYDGYGMDFLYDDTENPIPQQFATLMMCTSYFPEQHLEFVEDMQEQAVKYYKPKLNDIIDDLIDVVSLELKEYRKNEFNEA